MRRTVPLVALVVLALATATAPPAIAGSDGPTASAAARCSLKGKERRLGPTYVTSLSVTGVSCATGEKVVKDYYRCRVRHGGRKGHCRSRVRGFRCTEKRESISTQFDARVSCRKGSDRVKHDYTQFT
jgi:hypothetical protein